MQNYIIQDGCHNCRHIWEQHEYGDPDQFFCVFDSAGSRPKCGSVLMDEGWSQVTLGAWERDREKWLTWAEERRTVPWGKCNDYEGIELDISEKYILMCEKVEEIRAGLGTALDRLDRLKNEILKQNETIISQSETMAKLISEKTV